MFTNDYQWQQIMNIAYKYPNIKSIVIDDSNLRKMERNDLKNFPKLEYLRLIMNRLDNKSIK